MRFDERDVLFSRMNYLPGSPQHADYYTRHPDRERDDDALRAMPFGGASAHNRERTTSEIVESGFRYLADIKSLSEGSPIGNRQEVDPAVMTTRMKGLARFHRASLTGITRMREDHWYTHRGRTPEVYGQPVEPREEYGIAFAVEMDRDMVFSAPRMPEAIAVVRGYADAAQIGMMLSYYIRSFGYHARNHMDGNYLVVAPLVARDAGLGELGRHGLLITKEYGPRVRLGVVTTDMPLLTDEPYSFGVADFCRSCGKCAASCPGKAIGEGPPELRDGVPGWKVNGDACFRQWKRFGTDCGICLAACPYSAAVPDGMQEPFQNSRRTNNHALPDWLK